MTINHLLEGLSAPDAAEWLAGAGYELSLTLSANGDTIALYECNDKPAAEWPRYVTVVDPTEGGPAIIAARDCEPDQAPTTADDISTLWAVHALGAGLEHVGYRVVPDGGGIAVTWPTDDDNLWWFLPNKTDGLVEYHTESDGHGASADPSTDTELLVEWARQLMGYHQ